MTKILISPGYGAGWSTWNEQGGELERLLLTCEPLIEAVERSEKITLEPRHPALQMLLDEIERRWPGKYVCVLGAEDLKVAVLYGPFWIKEFDGFETVEFGSGGSWLEL